MLGGGGGGVGWRRRRTVGAGLWAPVTGYG